MKKVADWAESLVIPTRNSPGNSEYITAALGTMADWYSILLDRLEEQGATPTGQGGGAACSNLAREIIHYGMSKKKVEFNGSKK